MASDQNATFVPPFTSTMATATTTHTSNENPIDSVEVEMVSKQIGSGGRKWKLTSPV